MLPLHFLQSKKFIELLFKDEKYEILGQAPKLGKRFHFWFLTIDMYYCQDEPKVQPVQGLHLVGWHKPKDKDIFEDVKIPGWKGPFGKYIPISNPVPYIDAEEKEYFKHWSNRKQLYRKVWQKQLDNKELSIVECDMKTFLEHYLKSNFTKRIKNFNQVQMQTLNEIYKNQIFFYLIKDTKLDKIVAGLCTLHDQELNQVIKQYSFLDKKYKNIGVGMMDMCVLSAQKANLKYVNLTLINNSVFGSRGWRGFTQFKLEFNPLVTYFRQSYYKIMFNK